MRAIGEPSIQRPNPGMNHRRFLCSLSEDVFIFPTSTAGLLQVLTVIHIGFLTVIAGETLVAKLSGLVGVSTGLRVLWTFSLFLDTSTYIFPHQHPKDWSLEKRLCL